MKKYIYLPIIIAVSVSFGVLVTWNIKPDVEEIKRDIKKKKADTPLMVQLTSSENLKSSALMQINMMMMDFSDGLNLLDGETDKLKALLIKKGNAEIDVTAPILKLTSGIDFTRSIKDADTNKKEMEDITRLGKDVKKKLSLIQSDFEKDLETLLGDSRMEKFKKYKIEEMHKENIRNINGDFVRINTTLIDLDENQKEQLKKIYSSYYVDSPETIMIGEIQGFASAFTSNRSSKRKGISITDMGIQVKNVLRPDQLKKYEDRKKEDRKRFEKMMESQGLKLPN